MKTEQFQVAGMGCMNCSKAIQNALSDLEGVKSAVVNFEEKVANVDYDDAMVSKENLQTAVADAGYELIIA